jgi:hypothetical protein
MLADMPNISKIINDQNAAAESRRLCYQRRRPTWLRIDRRLN